MKNSHDRFSQMGRAAMLPGMQYALDVLQEALDGMRGLLSDLQQGEKKLSPQAAYWARMTPEERAAEMKRRGMGGRPKRNAQWSKKSKSKASKTTTGFWARMTSEERSAEMKRRRKLAKRNKHAALKAGSVRSLLNGEATQ